MIKELCILKVEKPMYIPDKRKNRQITLFDFNQSCGMQLDPENEWVRLAHAIPWDRMEVRYAALFPSRTGHPATPLRMALGILIIQKRKKLSDRAVIKEIQENPYLQYFIGMEKFSHEPPVKPTVLVSFRKRLTADFLMEANEYILETAGATEEHKEKNESRNAKAANTPSRDIENLGTEILDATCSPSNIRYPQDFSLLNEAREKLENMIDYFHESFHPWDKPRTYRRVARKEYLALAKSKKRTEKKIRATIRKQLGCVRRDLEYLERYMGEGYALPPRYTDCYLTIRKLYEQQKYMYDNKTHSVQERIVSISQPYLRPIVRGKSKAPVEFGVKYDVSIDEKGHARLEKLSFDAYNESTVFIDAMERYKDRMGHYPKRVLVDQIYRTRENRRFCKGNHIMMSGPKLGRPPKDKKSSREEYQDNIDRIEVERFFSIGKRCNGAGLIMTKLEETTLSSIALSVLVTNLFAVDLSVIFLLYFSDDISVEKREHYIIIDAAA